VNIDEWPFTDGDFRLVSARFGAFGWYFCPFDGSPWIFLSEDSGCPIDSLILELKFVLSNGNDVDV
jgi:hypothetical protein